MLSVTLITSGNLSLAVMDTFLGVGLIAFIFFYYLKSSHNYHTALMYSSGSALIYGIIRQLLFKQVIFAQISESSVQSLELMQEMFADNQTMLSLAEQSAQTSVEFFQNYGTAIWFMVAFFAIYLGSLWLATRTKTNWKQALFCLPYWSVYLLIAAMVFFLIPVTRIAGANLLLIIAPSFFIQGIAISNYFWNFYVKNNRFVFFFLVTGILLNYVLFLFLVILGIADLWLLFRQKHQAKLKSMK